MVQHTDPNLLTKLRGLTSDGDKDDDGDGSQGDHGPHRTDSWRDPAIDLQNAALRAGGYSKLKQHPLLSKQVSTAVDNKKISKQATDNPDAEQRHELELKHRLQNQLQLGKSFNPKPSTGP